MSTARANTVGYATIAEPLRTTVDGDTSARKLLVNHGVLIE